MENKKMIVIGVAAILIIGIGWFVYSKVRKPENTPVGENKTEDPKEQGSYKKWGNDYVREPETVMS